MWMWLWVEMIIQCIWWVDIHSFILIRCIVVHLASPILPTPSVTRWMDRRGNEMERRMDGASLTLWSVLSFQDVYRGTFSRPLLIVYVHWEVGGVITGVNKSWRYGGTEAQRWQVPGGRKNDEDNPCSKQTRRAYRKTWQSSRQVETNKQ